MPDALEERLAAMAPLVPEPPLDATARARAATLAAASAAGRPRAIRRAARALQRPARVAVALAAVAGVGSLIAALIVATPDDATRPAALRPDVAGLGAMRECVEPRLLEPCVAGTEVVRQSQPAIAGAPWLYLGRHGSQPPLRDQAPRPSLVFPPGITYGQALDALVVSVVLTGRLPAAARLAPPLPDGVVLLRPADDREGIALDLRAPFGYSPPSGRVHRSLLVGPAGAAPASSGPTVWPVGPRIAVPTLPNCMVIADRAQAPAPCGPEDEPVMEGLDDGIGPLPIVPWTPVDLASRTAAGIIPAASRVPAPALRLPVVGSPATLSLKDLRGKVVMVSVFASWCTPCAAQAPVVRGLAAANASVTDVAVVGLVLSDLRTRAREFVRTRRLTFPVLFDDRHVVVQQLGIPAVPETLLLDRRGRVALRIAGPIVNARQVSTPLRLLRAEAP